jgi:RNA polymerase sigma-70 factor (ECF subfamily)
VSAPSDGELLAAWQAGDRRAGAGLFDRHFRAVARFARAKVWSEEEVDDVVQATFLACLEAPEQFRGEGSLRGYLLGIAWHKLQKLYGHKARSPVDVAEVSVHDLGPGPSTAVARRAEQRLLLAGLRRLPLQFQVVLELSFWEEMTAAAIGAALGEPEGTVRTRLRRAKELLAGQLKRLGAAPNLLESTVSDLEGWARSLRAELG